MAEEGEDLLCLSGRPKMMSRKMEPPREKKSSLMEVQRKERPKTAVRKLAQLKIPLSRSARPRSAAVTPIPGGQTNSRPMSARLPLKPVVGRGRVLRSLGSIDSGLSPHHSSPDQSSDDEGDSEESRGHDTTEEDDEEEESVDSGIIKVKISKYDDADEEKGKSCDSRQKQRDDFADNEVDATSEENTSKKESSLNFEEETKSSKVIFVKEAGIEDDNDSETETVDDEMLDEEMDAGNGEVVFTGHQKITPPSNKEEEGNGFEHCKETVETASLETDSTVSRDMVLTDVEPHELCGILARQERRDDMDSAGQQAESQKREDTKTGREGEERPSYEKRMEDVISRLELEEKKTYDLAVYKTTKEMEDNSTDNMATKIEPKETYDLAMYKPEKGEEDIKEKLPVDNDTKDKEQLMYDVSSYQSKGKTNSAKKEEDGKKEVEDYTSLADGELAELKRKCLARVEKHKTTPIVSNPPVIKDFSNSQKLINFLDKTEEKDRNTINNVKRSNYTAQVMGGNGSLPSLSELLTKSVAELSEEVITLKLELETEKRSCSVLRTGLEQLQRTSGENNKQLVRESKQRLEAQRQEYEGAIARHQSFIDQLIEDKKSISQKCESLTVEMRTAERRSKENTKAMESRHNLEMSRIKQVSESSDRLKRERWMDQKAKKIKDQTVRSLESEVQKIMNRHASELSELKARNKQSLEEQEVYLRSQFQKQYDQVKNEAERDKKEAAEQEKLFQLERFRKQAEQMESFHRAEVGRLKEEIERERERREEERHKWMLEAEHIRKIGKERGALEVERVKEEMEEMRKSLQRRSANELTTLKANEESERKEFERSVRERMEKEWTEKETSLRAQFTRERDQEIDRVIEKLEFEMKKARDDSEKSTEARIGRLKAKHETEIDELAKEIEEQKSKGAEVKEKLVQKEGEAAMLASINKQMEVQLAELGAIKTKLITERNDVAAVVRKEFAENLDRLTDENSRMATELQNQVVAHKAECLEKDLNLRGAKNDFEKNINQLHEKVQMTIEKKEKVIEELQGQHELAMEKIAQLESIITQQSVDMVSKNKRSNAQIERIFTRQQCSEEKTRKGRAAV